MQSLRQFLLRINESKDFSVVFDHSCNDHQKRSLPFSKEATRHDILLSLQKLQCWYWCECFSGELSPRKRSSPSNRTSLRNRLSTSTFFTHLISHTIRSHETFVSVMRWRSLTTFENLNTFMSSHLISSASPISILPLHDKSGCLTVHLRNFHCAAELVFKAELILSISHRI